VNASSSVTGTPGLTAHVNREHKFPSVLTHVDCGGERAVFLRSLGEIHVGVKAPVRI
jgi:hypothetical protein